MHSNILNNYRLERSKPRRPLILVVDNDRDNLLFASYVIQALGIDYLITDDSQKCLELVHEHHPDMILLDIVMPKLDGLEITRSIRKDRQISHISIVAVTGLTKPEDKTQLLAAGCDDYLRKPYLIEELETKIYKYLSSHLK